MKNYDILNSLQNKKSVCLIGHVNADPDALSSMVVFKDILKSILKISRVDLFSDTQTVGDILLEILESNKIYKNLEDALNKEYEACIVLDCPNTDRLGCFKYLFDNAAQTYIIDHHSTNLYQAHVNIVENTSSCCEIIYNIANYFNYQLNNQQKGKLYAGIITDTNNFTVGNYSDETFRACSDLSKDIDTQTIYKAFLSNNTLKTMNLLALAINNIESFNNNEIIISHITHEEANKLSATHDDLCKIVNQIATINTSKLVCFIEPREGRYYASMRAKEGYNVAEIAKAHGGGGHIGAAAFVSNSSLDETKQIVLTDFKKQLSQVQPKTKKLFY